MDYELLEHKADIKLRIFGNDFADLLKNAGRAFSDLVLPGKTLSDVTREFLIDGDSNEQLLVKFLNELIYLLQSENIIFSQFDIEQVDSRIHAICKGGYMDSTDNPDYDVKAATYHDVRVEKTREGLTGEVILDI